MSRRTLDLASLSAVALRSATARGDVSCRQIAQACIDRVLAREEVVKAWAHFDPDAILSQADKLDGVAKQRQLHGVPVGVKDVLDTFDMPTRMGSPIYRRNKPLADASCVATLREAGAIIFGKTVTCEFAGPAPAETTNPHDPTHTPGGSSSGSAAAVSDYMVPLAFGTQTGGSILRPASFCGVVGYKPTYGAINAAGLKMAAQSLDTIGFLARTVEDVELAARVLTNAGEAAWLPPETKLRIGVFRTHAWEKAGPSTRRALEGAAAGLAARGHRVFDVDEPAPFAALSETREIINDYERARALAHEWRTKRRMISSELSKSITHGWEIAHEDYVNALRLVDECRVALAPMFDASDVLLGPTACDEAPLGLAHTGDHTFQSIWTQVGAPTIHLPTSAGVNNLPVGVQLIGKPHQDAALLAAAQFIFDALGRGPSVPLSVSASVDA